MDIKEAKEDSQVKERTESPPPPEHKPAGGQRVLSVVVSLLTCAIALPVFLICFLKSPSPLQDVYTFGISYYNLVFVFLISAVCLIVSVFFFIKFGLWVTLTFFVLSLFCCVPLIMGLRNDLTLQQAILNAPFFVNWPFFLRPLYILIEILLPLGMLLFLFLQLKSIFSRKPSGYIFLGTSLYLAAAAFIGFSGLLQAGEPTLITALVNNISVASVDHSSAFTGFAEDYIGRGEKIRSGGVLPPGSQGKITDQSENTMRQDTLPVEDSKVAVVDRKAGLLRAKTNEILEESRQVDNFLAGQRQSAPVSGEPLPPAVFPKVSMPDEKVLAKIDYRLGILSERINQVVESLERAKKPAAENRQPATIEVGQKVEQLIIKLDQLLSALDHNGYSLAQLQGSVEMRDRARSSPAENRTISSNELAGLIYKIELLADKVNRISEMLMGIEEKGGDNQERS